MAATVKFIRKEVKDMQDAYMLIRDCLEGESTIKSKGTRYLPKPNASDTSTENDTRYLQYKLRATFYNVTKRTLDGLCGQIFARDPVIEIPDVLDPVKNDADGMGVDIVQLAKRATKFVVGYGRSGVFVDYPETEGQATKAQIDAGETRPTLTIYDPAQIINWRTKSRGAKTVLSLVVLEETVEDISDEFETKTKTQYRVLRLGDGDIYTVQVYSGAKNNFTAGAIITPTDANGQPFNEIPFMFIGAENNDATLDEPPMYDIASLNVAHYRNSADYEESAFMVGQPTPVFSGLTEDWVTNVLKGKVYLGARGSISLPVGGSATLLQANENSLPKEAMEHKEKQMVALGARLVEQRTVVRTATEASNDKTSEESILASSAKNVSTAFTWALKLCLRFINGSEDATLKFALNTDFDLAKLTPEDRRQLVEEWQSGGLSFAEYRSNLRRGGIATLDDDTARQQIDDELANLPAVRDNTSGTQS